MMNFNSKLRKLIDNQLNSRIFSKGYIVFVLKIVKTLKDRSFISIFL